MAAVEPTNSDDPYRPLPTWPTCVSPTDGGCVGIQVAPYDLCWAHLPAADLSAALLARRSDKDFDGRGTTFDAKLCAQLFDRRTEFGTARFELASFPDGVDFSVTTFGPACFTNARFGSRAVFRGATFAEARFDGVRFDGDADFTACVFDIAVFRAKFAEDMTFTGSQFRGDTRFECGAGGSAWLDRARFDGAQELELAAEHRIDLEHTHFESRVILTLAAGTPPWTAPISSAAAGCGILVGLGMGAEPALRLVVGSVIFRDGDEDLSAAESWTVMAAPLLGPVLLALAVLSVRSRIKR